MNLTFQNIDLQNREHLARAVAALHTYAAAPEGLLRNVQSLTISLSSDPVAAPAVGPSLGIYGATTRKLLQTMITLAERNGHTALEEVARDMGISLDSARANLRNAGRTAAAHKVSLPVAPTWNPEKGCNEYRVTGTAS